MRGLRGVTGDVTGEALLRSLQELRLDGTLALADDRGSLLLLLREGEVAASHRLGGFASMDAAPLAFHVERHAPSDLPTVHTAFEGSQVPLLRALPLLGPGQELPTGVCDLRALIRDLRDRAVTGLLTLAHRGEAGAALFVGGRIAAAAYEREGLVTERSDALRAVYRYSLEESAAPLRLHPLDGGLARALAGLALGRRARSAQPASFSGVQAGESGYVFHHDGQPLLLVRADGTGGFGRFEQAESLPDLHLPDDPPGWEQGRYALTLRGRDALNPMTELSMRFLADHGSSGRKVLEALRSGLSIEDAAQRLGLELDELKPWLARLEQEGLIRARGAAERL